MSAISRNLQAVNKDISTSIKLARRQPDAVNLLAVSKSWGVEAVIAAAEAGQRRFGENYEQEAVAKMAAVQAARPDLTLEWHYIGPIQSNKTRSLAEHFDWVHTVDRERIAKRLSDQRPTGKSPLNVCIQVNVSGEETKSGVLPDDVEPLARTILTLPRLRLRGLMAIPAPEKDVEKQRAPFKKMQQLFASLREKGIDIDTLSMGMSDDLGAAIAEGATMVRVGTAIFGQRKQDEKRIEEK